MKLNWTCFFVQNIYIYIYICYFINMIFNQGSLVHTASETKGDPLSVTERQRRRSRASVLGLNCFPEFCQLAGWVFRLQCLFVCFCPRQQKHLMVWMETSDWRRCSSNFKTKNPFFRSGIFLVGGVGFTLFVHHPRFWMETCFVMIIMTMMMMTLTTTTTANTNTKTITTNISATNTNTAITMEKKK